MKNISANLAKFGNHAANCAHHLNVTGECNCGWGTALAAYQSTSKENAMRAELIQDKNDPNSYRIEAIDADGGCEVAIFSGPNAKERAISFAGAHYDECIDQTGAALTASQKLADKIAAEEAREEAAAGGQFGMGA